MEKFNPFVDDSLERLELTGGLYVDIRKAISFEEWEKAIKSDIAVLQSSIVAWNFTDKDGLDVPCTAENIAKLNSKVTSPIAMKCLQMYMPLKKH